MFDMHEKQLLLQQHITDKVKLLSKPSTHSRETGATSKGQKSDVIENDQPPQAS